MATKSAKKQGKEPGRPRKDLAAARAIARAAKTGESLADAAKAEGVSPAKAYQERARLASLPAPVAARPALAVDVAEDPEPSDDEIANVDTLDVARSVLLSLRKRFKTADAVRVGPLAEKILSAINRIEQIERNRPRAVPVDEVTRRLVDVREAAENRILAIVEERAAKLEADRADFAAWARSAFGEHGGAEAVRRLDAMLGGPT